MVKEMSGGSGIGVGAGTGTTFGDDKVVDIPGDGDGDGVQVGSDMGVGVGVVNTEALDGAAVVCTTNKADASTGKTTMGIVEEGATRLVRLWVSGELRALFRRPWFTRVWVVQEACQCADTVFVCGMKPPVSYDIVGAIALCMIHAVREVLRKSGYAADWDGVSPLSTDIELLAGVMITRDVIPVMGLFIQQIAQSHATRERRLQQIMEGEGGDNLFRLLTDTYTDRFLSRETKLHRDRVYALLGLAADVGDLEIKPDYSGQTGTAQILIEVAKAIIGKTKDGYPVELLSYSQFPKTILDDGSHDKLPSWVPDWRSGLRYAFYYYTNPQKGNTGTNKKMLMACGPHRSVEMVPNRTAGILGLRGYLVDTIEVAGGMVYRGRFNLATNLQVCDHHIAFFEKLDRLWELSKQKDEPIYETPARREEALWRVPVGDIASDWQMTMLQHRTKTDLVLEYHRLRRSLEQLQALEIDMTAPGWMDCMDEDKKKKVLEWTAHSLEADGGKHYDDCLAKMAGKSLYLTKKGYMGMGPHEMKSGDVVTVFPGARIPFVLRPTAEEDTFTYIGDAYCDGIMDGEITLREEKRDFFLV
ncbi:hypothetical protein B0H65DRAFT_460440 [Neurospora tetraspora]|uniref:Heterokaryon incompatibility domain-containing protein n=1 Tax=Neurospora tetraspora TaxID=94610 RepID=A0AAE0MSE9_9PEZI|nr:hypothetical protein B0H65DRAFT_460440 [Neurospora tetraspora]